MLDIIANNPFRTLGAYSNSKQADIVKNVSKMKAYLNVGRAVDFPTDMQGILPGLSRTVESAQAAQAAINLPNDKIRYALFWFCNADTVDATGLNNLASGDADKAQSIFARRESFSSLINRAVLALIKSDYQAAYSAYSQLVHNYTYRGQFCASICGDTFQISEDDLSHLFLDELLKEVKTGTLLGIIANDTDKSYVREKAIQEPLSIINREIAKAKNVTASDAPASLQAGRALIKNTRSALSSLRSIAGAGNIQYQSAADNLAKQILQCGINYYNNSDDDNDVDYGLELQEYALSIAAGQMTKDRCQKNVDILRKKKSQAAFSKDIEAIVTELKSLQSSYPSISRATSFVNSCKPHLAVIKSNLGSTNDEYLTISSAVANNALGMVISVVNSAQSSSNLALNITSGSLATTIDSAISAMSIIGSLDMNSSERSHFNQNNGTLSSLKTQLSSLSSYRRSSYGGGSTYRSSSSSSSDDTNWGCIGAVIIGVILVIFTIIISANG